MATGALPIACLAIALHISRLPAVPSGAAAGRAAIDGIAIAVANMDRAVEFYATVLSFSKVSDTAIPDAGTAGERGSAPTRPPRVVRMRLGSELIELAEHAGGRGGPIPDGLPDDGFQGLAIVVNDIEQAYLWLRRHKVRNLSPVHQRAGAPGIRVVSFRDTDGHPLEIVQFAPGQGQPRWQSESDSVFLGIDHIALAVADARTAAGFYQDTFGMGVVAQSGDRITLRAGSGPDIELIEHLTGRAGQGPRADTRADRLARSPAILIATSVPPPARPSAVSRWLGLPGKAAIPEAAAREGSVLRDPDGHAVHVRPSFS